MKITIKWRFEVEDVPPGDVLATGNEEEDCKAEQEIMNRLNNGDVWAWFIATCEAAVTIDDETFVGRASVGGCSYRDRKDFLRDAGKELRDLAIEYMRKAMQPNLKRAQAGERGLLLLDAEDTEIEEVES